MSQLMRAYPRCFYCLCNKGVNIIKLRLAQFNVHTAQNINGICHCLPVEGHIIIDFQIQVPVQSLNRLFRSSYRISVVQLIVGSLLGNIQISISVYRNKPNLTCIPVDIADHVNIRIGSLGHNIASGIHAEEGNGPIALHLLCHILGNLVGSNAVHIEILRTLNLCHGSGYKAIAKNQSQRNTFCNNHNQQTAASLFFLNLSLNSGRQTICACRSLTGALSGLRGLFPSRLRTCASASGGCCPASAPSRALLASEAAFCSSRKGFRLTCLLLMQLAAFSFLPQFLFTAVIRPCCSISGSVAAVSSGILAVSCFTSAPAGILCPVIRGS